jgi:hypothetical protein
MSGKRMWAVLLVVALLSLPLGSALAQGGPQVFCGDLGEADCNILVQSQAAMMGLESSTFDLTVNFTLAGVEDVMPGHDEFAASLHVVGVGGADVESLTALQSMVPDHVDEMMQAMPEALVTFLRSIKGQATLEVGLPPEVMATIPVDTTEGLSFDFVMVDGVLYVNIERLASLFATPSAREGTQPEIPAWFGLDLGGMYEAIFDRMAEEMTGQMEEMQGIFSSEMFESFSNPEILNEFMTVTRLDDVEQAGQTMAVFQTTLDYEALLTSEAFQTALQQWMQSMAAMQGEAMREMPENFDQIMAEVMRGISVEVVEWVGLDDFFTHHMEIHLAFALDREALAELVPEGELEDIPENFAVTLDVALDLSAFNEPVEVTAPADAQVINPMMFMTPGMMPSSTTS